MSAYKFYHLSFQTPEGEPITSGLQVTVVDPATADGIAATIYSDEGTTALTNSITSTVFGTNEGVVEFYSKAATVDILVRHATTGVSAYIEDLTPLTNFIVFDWRKTDDSKLGRYTDVVTISSVDYLIPEYATALDGATMTLATTSLDDAARNKVTIATGATTGEIMLGDPGSTVVPGQLTVVVNRGGAVIETQQADTTNNRMNGMVIDVKIADGGYLVLMEAATDNFQIIDSLGCTFVAQNT